MKSEWPVHTTIQCYFIFILNSYAIIGGLFEKWLTNGSLIKTRTERRKVREVEDKCSLIVNVAFHVRD